jgi:uncharacterized protein
MEGTMIAKEVMSSDVVAVQAATPLLEAVDRLEHSQAGVLAVYEGTRLLGTVTEHDIASWIATPGRDVVGAQARDVVHPEAVFSREDQDITDVARLMREHHVSSIVVVRDSQPVGTLTLADLATKVNGTAGQPADPAQRQAADQLQDPVRAIAQNHPATTDRAFESAPPARVFLQPIASPSILGLLAFAASTFMLGAYYAGWFGSATTAEYLAPFVAIFGGLAQLIAAMWAFRARDGLATAVHGTWGSFYLAFGVLYAFVAGGSLTAGGIDPGFGWWFIPLAAITGTLMLAAIGRNLALSATMLTLMAACIVMAAGLLVPSSGWVKGGGDVLVASALVAWYAATAILLEDSFRHVILPLTRPQAEANIPGRQLTWPLEWRFGQPGVRAGQ